MGVEQNRKIAIVAVHGIGPQQRYVMQDLVAGELADHLGKHTGHVWTPTVFYPSVNQREGAAQSYASALRVAQADGHAGTVFDVYEAYWSPIDKGKTTVTTVFSWILKTLFVPLSTTARMPAGAKKLLFDGLYTAVAMIIVLALFAGALFLTTWGYSILAPGHVPQVQTRWQALVTVLTSPASLFQHFAPWYLVAIAAAFAAMYLLLQVLVAVRAWLKHPPKASLQIVFRRGYAWWQFAAAASVLIAAAALAFLAYRLMGGAAEPARALFAAAGGALALRLALSMAQDFFVNRIGDVQIYTTHDWNSELHALRDQIIETVQRTIQQVLDSDDYERVYILGHSLGSTIAMDALIRLHQLVEGGTLAPDAWRRIRAFVTFGTALEKTKFFFDLAHPSLSQSYDQWRGEVYGHLFSRDWSTLNTPTGSPHKIYWRNYWYFTDLVANEIRTYRDSTITSEQRAHGRSNEICWNVPLRSGFPLHPWVHSDYLQDTRFWTGPSGSAPASTLLDVLLARDEPPQCVTDESALPGSTVSRDGSPT